MTTTIRAYKGLVTKRNDVALNWLQESAQLLERIEQGGVAAQGERAKEITMDITTCEEYIDLLEASVTKLTKAFDGLQDATDEEEDQLDNATIDHHLETTANDDDMAPEIRRNLYVDNLFFGAQSSNEALLKYAHTKKLFQDLKMNLREFCSNDKTFSNAIDEADKMKSTCPKVLGIAWNSETDKFIIKGSMTTLKGKDTKRTVTQQLASVYDPMGFLVPLLLPAKIFMQSLWKEGLDWDTLLPAQLRDQWHQITSEIATFYKEVNRRILSKSDGYRLVVFTDASQCAIAACAYLTSQEESSIIMAKSKLPSIKTSMTVPKLEMNALTLGEVILYTDSDIVLGWIRTPPSRQSAGILVTNRLSEIRRISNDLRSQSTTCLFGHVSTAENPADCGTRGLSAEALQNHIWWTGPEFTNKPDHSKLSTVADFEQSTMISVEAVTLNPSEEVSKDEVVDLSRYSTLEKAQRVLVYALRFINRSLSHFPHERRLAIQQHIPALKEISPSQTITGIEMHESRMCLIRDHQKNYVNEHQIKSQKELNIRQDEKGTLRCYERLQQADVPVTAKTPIYIAPKTIPGYADDNYDNHYYDLSWSANLKNSEAKCLKQENNHSSKANAHSFDNPGTASLCAGIHTSLHNDFFRAYGTLDTGVIIFCRIIEQC
ncbi:unnamed protein product [Cylicocyclus nassatus]|uniref:Uncharacterized protein n=1 Tax=Cylicocyclus nassatus TaxID=53992 RepID=A0AA36H6H4_CYLNA|nr:unnamed protein product [Cylicocyclus nassatus]